MVLAPERKTTLIDFLLINSFRIFHPFSLLHYLLSFTTIMAFVSLSGFTTGKPTSLIHHHRHRHRHHHLSPLKSNVLTSRVTPTVMTLNVLVTGAAGRTGSIVFNLLDSNSKFSVTGLVRDESKARNNTLLGTEAKLIEGDITIPETLLPAMQDQDALVVLTSAVPRMEPSATPAPGEDAANTQKQPPSFYYDAGGMPEDVDWVGARSQIDLAKSLGLKHVVFIGSMGSTEENNPLNKIGNGNILKFKRKAENYLIESGIPYTIINPGGLLTDPPNERELVIGKADELFSIFERRECGIPRADVARVIVSALLTPEAKNKVFDLVAKPKGQGHVTTDPSVLFEGAYATL